jgi:hypothetical protein
MQKELVTYYNSAGQKIKQFWYWNGEPNFHNVEIFSYSTDSLISSLVDSFADGNIETTSYLYKNINLKQRVTFNQNNDTCDFRIYPDNNTTIKRWYTAGKSYRYDTTIFEKENIKSEYYGSENSQNEEKPFAWHYKFLNQFDSKGNVIMISFKVENPHKSFTRYIYDNRSLLIKKQEIFFAEKKEIIRTEYYFTYD